MVKNTKTLINEMKTMLNDKKRLTVENFIFSESEDDDYMEDDVDTSDIEDEYTEEELPDVDFDSDKMSDVREEVNQIRQIALKAIARLADDPQNPSYELMKKIWNMCDKTVDSKDKGDK